MKQAILNIQNLSYEVSAKSLLQDIDLSVSSKEHLAIVGENGAGKSTLFKAIMRLIDYQKGTVEVDGKPLKKMSRLALAQQVSYVPQTLNLSADFSVRDYLTMSCFSLAGKEKPENRVSEVLERLQLNTYAETMVMALSGGEKQRISIAAAIIQNAKIMLLDEPTAHLDLYQSAKVKHWLKQVKSEENLTTLTITHDLNWVAADFDRAICLKDGGICYDGEAKSLLDKERLKQNFGIIAEIVTKPDGIPMITESYPSAVEVS